MGFRSSNRSHAITVSCLGLAAAACPHSSAAGRSATGSRESQRNTQFIALSSVADSAPARWWGLTNIFFTRGTDSVRRLAHLPEGASAVEFATIVAADRLVPIHAARLTLPGSDEVR